VAVKKQPIAFGKYYLLDRINIGGMAEVWRAKMYGESGFEKLVAIKRILPNIAEDEEFITMFIDEAKISVQLTHPNIAQVFDLGRIGDSYFIAMEYVAGRDLKAIFDRGRKRGEPAPIPLTCYAIAKMCEGLDHAHRKRDAAGLELHIVHRDVSPQNCLVSYEGEVKVIDFGIAKAANKASQTQAGILKGKFGYMSPEQVRGLPLDQRSDVFSAGIVLYEMLTGERLFTGESDFSVLEKVRQADVLPPTKYNRRIPEGLEKIVLTALAKDPDERYPYASDLANALQRYVVTSDAVFSRRDLMQSMKSTFAEDVENEKLREAEYAAIRLPRAMGSQAQSRGQPAAHAAPLKLSQEAPPKDNPGPVSRGAALRKVTETPLTAIADERTLVGFGIPTPVEMAAADPRAPGERDLVGDRTRAPRGPRAVRAAAAPDNSSVDETLFASSPHRPDARPAPGLDPARPAVGRPLPPNLDGPVRSRSPSASAPDDEPSSGPSARTRARPSRLKWILIGAGAGLAALLAGAAIAFMALGTGSVQVSYEPGDARVYLDGKEVCVRSPCIVSKLEPRPWTLEVRKDHFEGYVQAIEVPRNEVFRVSPDVKLELVATGVPAVIASDPGDAEVAIDGKVVKALGVADIWSGPLSVGQPHEIAVSKPGYSTWKRAVSPAIADGPLKEFARLERVAFKVSFVSTPPGADVLVDDTKIGSTPLTVETLDPSAAHTVVLQKRCFENVTRTLVAGSPSTEINAALRPAKERGCPERP
jgi:serine/threonine protein kinase